MCVEAKLRFSLPAVSVIRWGVTVVSTKILKHALTAIAFVLYLAAPGIAGPLEDAIDANNRGDPGKAIRLLRPLANDGNALAQYNLAQMYSTGRGVDQDDAAAVVWFRKSAEQDYAFAQSNLGVMYLDGRGVPQDFTKAIIWFRKAAEQGDALAQFSLGVQYSNGPGASLDNTEALKWFRKAADQGHPRARLFL
jgi:uncharacterized protein